ncbi:phosphotransferase [Nonomuraea sp. MCN248]|uniref:Phosphotransferase n=1 Tax=Nonomuraea corallina TaxID=2989783 RepID=A0ABT4S911_9ACTN|nr:phosphotransferase [Nonomuraea corallina]MDA0633543.1 phosphotransferase [Nonomuraea corallina]
MAETRLEGGNDGGAVRIGATVRRAVRAWTPAVHELLRHLERAGFDGAPRVLGVDDQGREVLTFLEGETLGTCQVWPEWTRTEDALRQVARWLRDYHAAVAGFRPPADTVWRGGGRWRPGLIIAHNDASAFNAAWHDGRLTGFFDWDFAGPVSVESDVAWMALSWVPLHSRHVAAAEGFTAFDARPRRLRLFLSEYGWRGDPQVIVKEIQARMTARALAIRRGAAAGDILYTKLLNLGTADDMDRAVRELKDFSPVR